MRATMTMLIAIGLFGGVVRITHGAAIATESKSSHYTLVSSLQSLLRVGVPVGVQLGMADRLEETAAGPAKILDEVPTKASEVANFSATWQPRFGMRETRDQGLVVVSPKSVRCTQALARPMKSTALRGTPVEVLFGIAVVLDPSLERLPPPGIVSGGGDGGGTSTMEALTQRIELSTQEGESLLDALNRVAASARGIGWIAQDRCDSGTGQCSCPLSLLTTTAVAYTSYDAAAGLEPPKVNVRP
jgi:hypothetical protein